MTQHLLIFWLATIAAAVSGLMGCTGKGSASAVAPRVVQVTRVQFSGLDNTLRAVGLLTPKDEMRLSFKVAGLIESIKVEEGQAVKAGQVLAVLKQAEIGASLEQARQATAKAQRDLDRGKALLADGVTTEEQVQDLTTAFSVAGAAQRGTEFNAAHTRIAASADGVVLRKLAEANELVQAGQTVLILGGASRGWVVRVGLADRDAVRTRVGDAARIEFDAWPGQVFAGRVSNISSAADSATGTFTVEVQVTPGSAHFVQGLVAKVLLTMQGEGQVKVIPVQALLEANDKEAGVFVLDEAAHDVHRVSIQIGRMSAGRIEVLDGLAPDAQVVTDGAAFLANGEKVRVLN
ncbi:MAG: efflux RND transporter periplasmic adaptor subunit [Pseudomonadota bacterium]|nr:efflux RND transporter periplasmic adaptor subunit [Pseudomonadota bacterium]